MTDPSYCRKCRYYCAVYNTAMCDYCVQTGQPRGCPAGDRAH